MRIVALGTLGRMRKKMLEGEQRANTGRHADDVVIVMVIVMANDAAVFID